MQGSDGNPVTMKEKYTYYNTWNFICIPQYQCGGTAATVGVALYMITLSVLQRRRHICETAAAAAVFIYLYNIKGQPSLIIKNITILPQTSINLMLVEMFVIIIVYNVYMDIGSAIHLHDTIINYRPTINCNIMHLQVFFILLNYYKCISPSLI